MLTRADIDALRVARARIARGWCQGMAAADEAGNKIEWREDAPRMCLLGACAAGTWRAPEADGTEIHRALAIDLPSHYGPGVEAALMQWNDASNRTKEQVLALIDDTIVREEAALARECVA